MTEHLDQEKGFAKHIWETLILAGPVIVSQLGHVAIGQADTIMVGELGPTNLGAATLANGIWILFTIVGMGIFSAVGPLAAQWIGANRSKDDMGGLLQQSLMLSLVIGVVICLLQFVMAEFLHLLSQPPDVVVLAKPYLRIIAVSSIPMLAFLAIKNFVEGYERTWPGMVVMGFIVLSNVLLNWLLINGIGGLPRLGLDGAGWATLIARVSGVAAMAGYLFIGPEFKGMFRLKGIFSFQVEVVKSVFRIGLPAGMQYLFEIGAFVGAVILAGWIGEDALSAHQIAIGVASTTFMFYLGFAIAASIRVGNALGRGDNAGIRLAGLAGFTCTAVAISISVAAMIIFREQIPKIYIDDPVVLEMTVPLLVVAAFFQLFDGVQAIGAGVLRGMSDVRIPTVITFVAYWVIGMPAALVCMLIFDWGLEGIWYGLTAGLAFSAVAMSLRFFWKTRQS